VESQLTLYLLAFWLLLNWWISTIYVLNQLEQEDVTTSYWIKLTNCSSMIAHMKCGKLIPTFLCDA
jgi:hypothetical protein